MNKKIAIWGAGKIGRGLIAEAFDAGGYDLVFVDSDRELVENLRREGSYTIVKASPEEEPVLVEIAGFEAYTVSQRESVEKLVAEVPYIAVALFPGVFDALATALLPGLARRAEGGRPLDILISANTRGAAEQFRAILREKATGKVAEYLQSKVGVVETVIMRIAISTPERFAAYGPLTVTTNGFPYVPVERDAFRGPLPEVPILRPVDGIEAEEARKFFTYNMAHAVFAYAGNMRGHETILQAAEDPAVLGEVRGALREIAGALELAYGFSEKEMEEWNASVLRNVTNPLLEDSLDRLGKDPIRKLGPGDRLIGPALLCKQHGKLPFYITKTIARAFFYRNDADPAAEKLAQKLETLGVAGAIREVGELDRDPEIVYMVADHFRRIRNGLDESETPERVAVLREAYESGFYYEKKYHGCAQCALAAMFDVSGEKDPGLFQAASAMAGGIGLTGDGVCGGYAAGVLWMGRHVGRRLDRFDGDKEAQYSSFDMTQRLRDRYIETYGTLTCRDIHEKIFGRPFVLRTKAVRNEFEAAGAHRDRCTSVVAMASMWTSEILMEEGFLDSARNSR